MWRGGGGRGGVDLNVCVDIVPKKREVTQTTHTWKWPLVGRMESIVSSFWGEAGGGGGNDKRL